MSFFKNFHISDLQVYICWQVCSLLFLYFWVSISSYQSGESLLNPYLNFCISFRLNLYSDSHKKQYFKNPYIKARIVAQVLVIYFDFIRPY